MPPELPSGRPRSLPDSISFDLQPSLVHSLTWAHREAGQISSLRLSHYGLKRLLVRAQRRRIAYMVARAGHSSVTLDEVKRVIAGAVLPPRRRMIQDFTQKAAVLCEAALHFGKFLEPTTPELCATYFDFLKRGTSLWANFAGQPRARLLEVHRGQAEPTAEVNRLYEWINGDALVSREPVLRAATLYWGLSLLHPYDFETPALDAIVDHEFRAGGIDTKGLLLLPETDFGASALRLAGSATASADFHGNLTDYYNHFTFEIARALSDRFRRLAQVQHDEHRLPWQMTRPPDQLDRQVFELIERLGSPRARDILEALSNPPPLRTLQRRLQNLCKDGLVVKEGERKFAYYRLADDL